MNILRRLPLSRLVLLCALVIGVGVSATALASALDSGPVPPAKPLALALHDALSTPSVEGVSASIRLTDRLLEGASLAGGSSGQLASSPLLTGAAGRLWVSRDGRLRLELQAERGDTQIVYDGHTVTLYDAARNTLYRYTPSSTGATDTQPPDHHEAPSVAEIEEAIGRLSKHANVSGAMPTDVAGQPTYTVRVSPKEGGSLIAGAELSFDAVHGLPLRAAIYSTTASAPVIELSATEISYGPVADSVFSFTPPADAKVEEVKPSGAHDQSGQGTHASGTKPHVTIHGKGLSAIAEAQGSAAQKANSGEQALEGLPKVSIDGTSASELRTALGTVLGFERAGVRYLLAGSVAPQALEAFARGL
jgi:outer membrane lipoprotein-sorting protein